MIKLKPNGFTLLEMLIVLAIWSTIILLTVPPMISSIENHKEKQFLRTFQHDVLLTQSNALDGSNYSRINLVMTITL
ncbi:type II secretion system protein [Ornithinibacillus halophilus]|nr:type II secretion system protein [Ornithinibacillus halophilus]